jgi:hypothetical protein
MLGVLVNPLNPGSIEAGILTALAKGKGRPKGLEHFSQARFQERVNDIVHKVTLEVSQAKAA